MNNSREIFKLLVSCLRVPCQSFWKYLDIFLYFMVFLLFYYGTIKLLHCLHCRGFTDVWVKAITIIVIPMFFPTQCHTVLIMEITWFTGVPVYKSQCTVVWRPNERPLYVKVRPSDPVITAIPIVNAQIWQRKGECDKYNNRHH